MDNHTIAERLNAHANQLVRERENLYRVRAYRQAAQSILALEESVEGILHQGGENALAALPGIGTHLAYTLAQLIKTGVVLTHPRSRSVRVRYGAAGDHGSRVA